MALPADEAQVVGDVLALLAVFRDHGGVRLGHLREQGLVVRAVPGFRQFKLGVQGLFALSQVRQDRDAQLRRGVPFGPMIAAAG